GPVAALDRLRGPVHREARGHENRRVDARDELRELVARGRPGRVVDDADEEVGREERAEDHDLRRDEEQHPERRRVDARALVRDRRAVVIGVCGGGAHTAPATLLSASTTTCSTGTPESLRKRPTTSRRSQLLAFSPGKVETMISSTRSSAIACMAAVYGSGCATWPCASMPASRSSVSAARSRRSACGCDPWPGSLCGLISRKLAGDRAARARIRSSSCSPTTVSFAITRTFRSPLAVCSTTTCSTGMSPATERMRSTTLRRSQPDFCGGCVG